MSPPLFQWRALWACLIVGFVLRLIGIGFGLPELYHADEPIVMNHAMAFGSGDLNPHFFQIPPFVSYLLFLIQALRFLAGRVLCIFSGPDSFAEIFLTNPTSFYWSGRFFLGTVVGTATIAAVYYLAKRVGSKKAATWAAAFLSVCFLHVRDSHYIYTDIPLCLALVLTLLCILNLYERGLAKDYVWSGIMIGICTSVKYNAALVAVAYVLAHCLRDVPLRAKFISGRFWLGALACMLAFVATNPFALLGFSFFCRSVARQGQAQSFVGWFHHLSYSLGGGIGIFGLIAALAGVGLAIYLKNIRAWIVLGFVVPFYLGITCFGQVHDRYVLPLIPFLAIFLGLFVDWVLEHLRPSAKPWIFSAFAALLIFPMFVKSAYSDWLFLQPDSRTLAKQWIEANVPAGTRIALDHTFYVPKLLASKEQLREKLAKANTKETSVAQKRNRLERYLKIAECPENAGQKRYDLYYLSDEAGSAQGFLFAEPQIPFDFPRLEKEGIKLVVAHASSRDRTHEAFLEQVAQHAKDVYRFTPYRDAGRDFSSEHQVRTGGAFLWREMLARRSNGELVLVYVLK